MTDHPANEPEFNEHRSASIRKLLVNVAQKGTSENLQYKNVRRAWIIAPTSALALALTGGTMVLLQAPITENYHIKCFARPERNGESFPGTQVTMIEGRRAGEPTPTDRVEIEDALATCSDLWRQHALDAKTPSGTPTGHGQQDLTFSHPVPDPLTVCVWDGMAAVIPGDAKVCAKLGLSEKAPTAGPDLSS